MFSVERLQQGEVQEQRGKWLENAIRQAGKAGKGQNILGLVHDIKYEVIICGFHLLRTHFFCHYLWISSVQDPFSLLSGNDTMIYPWGTNLPPMRLREICSALRVSTC